MFVKQRTLPSANVCEAGLIAKCECLWSSTEHTAETVTCRGKIYLS